VPLPENLQAVGLEVFQVYSTSASDIRFANFGGEHNITETAGFNITFCVAKYIATAKPEYHEN